jgi:hypothetical protein
MTTVPLSREHTHTLQALFQHPVTYNLEWRQIVALLEAVGTITETHDRHYHVTVNGQGYDLNRPHHKDFADVTELMALRHFMQRVGVVPTALHQQGDPGDGTSTHARGDLSPSHSRL